MININTEEIKMKIDPKHDYKKPLYAVGMAALIGATAMFGTACGPQLAGAAETTETEEVELAGAAETVEPCPTTEELVLDGEVAIDDPLPEKVENNGD